MGKLKKFADFINIKGVLKKISDLNHGKDIKKYEKELEDIRKSAKDTDEFLARVKKEYNI